MNPLDPENKPIIGDDGELLEADSQADVELYEDYVWGDEVPTDRRQDLQDFINNHIPHIIMAMLGIAVFGIISINQQTPSNSYYPNSTLPDPVTIIPATIVTSPLTRRYLPSLGSTAVLPSTAPVTQLRWSPNQDFIAIQNSVTGLSIWDMVQNKYLVSELPNYIGFDWSPDSSILYSNHYLATVRPQQALLSALRTQGTPFISIPELKQPLLRTHGRAQKLVISNNNQIAMLDADGLSWAVIDAELPSTLATRRLDQPAHDIDWIDESEWFSTVDDIGVWKWFALYSKAPYLLHKGNYQQVSWSPYGIAYVAGQDLVQERLHHPSVTVFTTYPTANESVQKWSQPLELSTLSANDPADFKVQVAWSPDGKRIATFVQHDTMLDVWDAETGEHLTRYYGAAGITSMDWSPGGLYLAIGASEGIIIWSPD